MSEQVYSFVDEAWIEEREKFANAGIVDCLTIKSFPGGGKRLLLVGKNGVTMMADLYDKDLAEYMLDAYRSLPTALSEIRRLRRLHGQRNGNC